MSHLRKYLVIVIVVTHAVHSHAIQSEWQRNTDQEAGFSISFPGRPTYEESTDPGTGQPLETYSFYYNGTLLRISFSPVIPAPKSALQINKILSDTAGLYATTAGTLLRQEKLQGGGRQFDNLVKTSSGILHLRSRVYIHKGNLFTLSCGSYDESGINEQVAERFFSSLKFIDVLPKGRSQTRIKPPEEHLSGKTESSRWYRLLAPDKDFVAEFPSKPDYSIDTSFTASPPLHQYRLFYGENLFSVSYRERSKPEVAPEQELKQALKNYHARLEGWELLRQVDMHDGYIIEHRGMASGHLILARTRLYLRGSRLYYVMSMTKNLAGPNKDDVNRFFSAFRLL